MAAEWTLVCSACDARRDANGLPGVCEQCGAPYLVRLGRAPPVAERQHLASRPWDMWRYREWLPIRSSEDPITLGEGGTPLLRVTRLCGPSVWVKDESGNPTGSFKARGLSAAMTRAARAGARRFVVPTAGNAGVALAAYATRAGCTARVYAPRDTPVRMLEQMRVFGADLVLVDGHIGVCGREARTYATTTGAVDVSTLREPYRIEGKKTLGLELAEQLGWELPDAIIYPTGGGTGLIGMWKAFGELRASGWVEGRPPRMFSVQAEGCAPVVDAWERGLERCEPPNAPHTVASGLRVPTPLGDRLMLTVLRESGGGAVAVSDGDLVSASRRLAVEEGIDAAPEGGASLAAYHKLLSSGVLGEAERVVLFNTGAGWLYADRGVA